MTTFLIKIGAVIPEIAKKIDDPFPPSTSTVIRWIRRYIENDYNLLNIYKVKSAIDSSDFHQRWNKLYPTQ